MTAFPFGTFSHECLRCAFLRRRAAPITALRTAPAARQPRSQIHAARTPVPLREESVRARKLPVSSAFRRQDTAISAQAPYSPAALAAPRRIPAATPPRAPGSAILQNMAVLRIPSVLAARRYCGSVRSSARWNESRRTGSAARIAARRAPSQG